ncbi:MAG: ATP-binding cassette domain-containing protein [Alteromonadaceae bacterium]|nr:ATP-binding cassette domain-containing protein [Alteromonadaceae bacterium]
MLVVDNLSKSVHDGNTERKILDGVSFSLEASNSMAIIGPSGSGKSTLLKLIATLDVPDAGGIRFRGEDISGGSSKVQNAYRKSHAAVVFQDFNLIDCISVSDNISFCAQLNKNVDKAYIEKLVETLNIGSLLTRSVQQLSGGEQQRVAIARALAHKPDLLLADEPTGNLDKTNSDAVAKLLIECCESLNTALVLVTHSEQLAAQTQRVMRLENGRLFDAVF